MFCTEINEFEFFEIDEIRKVDVVLEIIGLKCVYQIPVSFVNMYYIIEFIQIF